MPVMNGIEATKKALEIYPDLKIITLTMFEEEEYIESMLNAFCETKFEGGRHGERVSKIEGCAIGKVE
jgi:ribose 5-phosphate isomerase RpiB